MPVITVDYGDGRVLKRTVTGNSIHYIITSQGQVIDARPGLYDPKTFVAGWQCREACLEARLGRGSSS